MKEHTEGIITGVVVTLLVPIFMCYSAVSNAFVFMKAFNWLAVPAFHVTFSISLMQSIIVIYLISMTTQQYIPVPKKKSKEQLWHALLSPWAMFLVVVVIRAIFRGQL